MKRIMTLLAALLLAINALADTETVDGIEWNYTITDGSASIGTGEYSFQSAIPTSTAGAITIPATLGDYPVTSIGEWAFGGCTGLTSVTIGNSVTIIGDQAFYRCSSLKSVTIGDSVTSIGDQAFYRCSGLTSVTIPQCVCSSSLRHIFPSAYTNITSVTISDSVAGIGEGAFGGCTGLTSVTIPDSVTSIGEWAFSACSGLTSVTIPQCVCLSRLWYIFPSAYANITSVTISDSVTSIGEGAFYGCSGLTSVTMRGNSPSVEEDDAFDGVEPACIVHLPMGNGTYAVADGKWQGMTVVWYDAESTVPLWTAKGKILDFVSDATGRTATVPDGTAAEDIVIMLGDTDVTKAYRRTVEGTVATVRLMGPFEVGREEKRQDAASPWEENNDGTVTLNVEVVPGLYYAAASAGSLGDLKCPGADAAATDGMKLTVAKPTSDNAGETPALQGFYKVWVSDAPMAAE